MIAIPNTDVHFFLLRVGIAVHLVLMPEMPAAKWDK